MFLLLNKRLIRLSTSSVPSLKIQSDLLICRHKSYYTDLGLEPSASTKDIKAAYYNLSLKYHPDKNQGSTESTKKFREITEAYETLINPEKKRIYDRDLNIYGPSEFKTSNFYTKSDTYRRTSPPTGRTKDFNYDEHFRQHYEDYMRQRVYEQEHIRRRWESEMRYRQGNSQSWSNNYSTQNQYRRRQKQMLWNNRSIVSLVVFWIFMFVFGELISVSNPEKKPGPRPVYYKTSTSDGSDV